MIDLLKTIPGIKTPDFLKPLLNNQNTRANQGSGLLGLGDYQAPAQGKYFLNTLQGRNQGTNQLAPIAPLNQQAQVQQEPEPEVKPEPIRIPNASSFSGPPGWLDSLVRSTATGANGMNYWWNQNKANQSRLKNELGMWGHYYGDSSRNSKAITNLGVNAQKALNDQTAEHKRWWGDAQNAFGQYQNSIDQMAGAPALYDQWVDQAGTAYLNRQEPFEDTLRNPLNRISASGAFDSSLTRDVTTDLARQRAKGFQEHQEQLNTQALGLKAQNLAQVADARGNAAQLGGLMAENALSGRNNIWNQFLQAKQNQAQLGQNFADQAWAARLGYYNALNQNSLNSLNWLGNLANLARFNKSNTPQLNILPYL